MKKGGEIRGCVTLILSLPFHPPSLSNHFSSCDTKQCDEKEEDRISGRRNMGSHSASKNVCEWAAD